MTLVARTVLRWLPFMLPLALAAQPMGTVRAEEEDVRPLATFRLTFGVKDTAPKSWSGELLPATGQRLQIEPDHFRNFDFLGQGRYLDQERFADFPNDRAPGGLAWICATRWASVFAMRNRPAPEPFIQSPSLLIHVRAGGLDEPVRVRTPAGEFAFRPQEVPADRASYFLDGNVRVEAAPRVARVDRNRKVRADFPALLAARSGRLWIAWQEFDGEADSIVVRNGTGDEWSREEVLVAGADVYQPTLGEDAAGRIWAVWAMQVEGNWDLYGRAFDGKAWSATERLTREPGTDFFPKLQADSDGKLWLVWQHNGDHGGRICARHYDGRGWSTEELVSDGSAIAGNNWWPAVAAGPEGTLAIAWDGYAAGSYDVFLRRRDRKGWGATEVVAGTPRYEAQPSVAIDPEKRVWVAWNESGVNWGKDTGFLVVNKGTQLYESRSVRIACLDNGRWMTTAGPLPMPADPEDHWQMPHLRVDAQGRPNLVVRHLLLRRPRTPPEQPTNAALWEMYLTRYDGARWSDLVSLPRSAGRNDMMPATAATSGGLWGAWTTDGRSTKSFNLGLYQIQLGRLDAGKNVVPLALKPSAAESVDAAPLQPGEAEDVRRIRAYRVQHDGKTYSIYRGDLHRHTDISIDGAHDGSLLDAYRYGLDAGALDFLATTNHIDGGWDDYDWWMSQKVADQFRIGGRFTTFYGYERSIEFPNGHRNVFATRRGSRPVDIDGEEVSAEEGSERLYAYLHRIGGFCISHTTGRTSGTDWRNHDPEVESLVEIYQGERDVYEMPGGPKPKRLWSEWLDATKTIPIESSQENSPTFRRQGFVSNALAHGYKLGFIASSDHISTHVSYACLWAENLTPEGLLEAIRARRAYAATDNILLDVRAHGSDGEHLMGEAFASTAPVRIRAHIVGTGEILQVDVIRNGSVAQTYRPEGSTFALDYTEAGPSDGEVNYYVRVIQKSGDMAWASPVWVMYPQSAR